MRPIQKPPCTGSENWGGVDGNEFQRGVRYESRRGGGAEWASIAGRRATWCAHLGVVHDPDGEADNRDDLAAWSEGMWGNDAADGINEMG